MRFAAHAEHRAMHSRHHGRSAAPVPAGLKRLAVCANLIVYRAVPSAFDWCYGAVRFMLAACLIGLWCCRRLAALWSFDPASMRRSIGYSVATGLGVAAPHLQFR